MYLLFDISVYQSPLYESISFDLIVERMVAIGYPPAITEYKYDPSFPVRFVLHFFSSCIIPGGP